MSLKEEIIQNISTGKLNKALELLLTIDDDDFNTSIILLKSRYTRLETQYHGSLIYDDVYAKKSNILSKAALSYANQISDKIQSTTQSKPEANNMVDKIIEVKRFIKDYNEGMYPAVQDTFNRVYNYTEWAHTYFVKLFPEGTATHRATYRPWRDLLVDTKLSNDPDSVKVLVATMKEFIDEVSKDVEVAERKTEEQTLFAAAEIPTSTFEAIEKYVEYKISRVVGDKQAQLQNNWNTAKKEYDAVPNIGLFGKSRALNNLRDKWVVKNL